MNAINSVLPSKKNNSLPKTKTQSNEIKCMNINDFPKLEKLKNYDLENDPNFNDNYIFKDLTDLLSFLNFSNESIEAQVKTYKDHNFALKVPFAYAQKIQKNTPNDPLLLQVFPSPLEANSPEDFVLDPLQESNTNTLPGLIHKYKSRVLLTATGACTIHCRYCFRRHFNYQDNAISAKNWLNIQNYIKQHPDINEVILSGGDPLALSNRKLFILLDDIEKIPQIHTIRLHSRTAITNVKRLDTKLLIKLQSMNCNIVIVTHSNHPNEIQDEEIIVFNSIKKMGITLLNQSVMLKNINDNAEVLTKLSLKLFKAGIMPYYLHQLDKVIGASHFMVSQQKTISIYQQLLENLPGYLVPKLVAEYPNKNSKTPLNIPFN